MLFQQADFSVKLRQVLAAEFGHRVTLVGIDGFGGFIQQLRNANQADPFTEQGTHPQFRAGEVSIRTVALGEIGVSQMLAELNDRDVSSQHPDAPGRQIDVDVVHAAFVRKYKPAVIGGLFHDLFAHAQEGFRADAVDPENIRTRRHHHRNKRFQTKPQEIVIAQNDNVKVDVGAA